MSVILVMVPQWETCSLVLDVPPGAVAVTAEKGQVKAATLAAQKMGIRVGMKLNYARYLYKDLLVMPLDENRLQRSFAVVMTALEEVTPFAQIMRPGLACIPYAQNESKKLKLAEFLNQLVDAVALTTSVEAYVAYGESYLDAWRKLNNYLPGRQKCNSVNELPLSSLIDFFPEENNRVKEMLLELNEMGIETIAEIQALGWGKIQARFGLAAHTLKQLVAADEVKTIILKKELIPRVELEFTKPIQDPLLIVGQSLEKAQQLVTDLQEKQVSAQGITIAATLQIPLQIADEIGRKYLETQIVQVDRNWALFTFPTATEITARLQWQLQVWLQHYQAQAALQLDKTTYETFWDTEIYKESFGIKQLTITATELIPIGETLQKLWGNKTANDLRAIRTAEKLQHILGAEQTQQIKITAGWDPISKVTTHAWGQKPPQPAWETWKPAEKLASYPNSQSSRSWYGRFTLPAPSTVFTPPLKAQLLTASLTSVEITSTGLLAAPPTYLALEAKTHEYLLKQLPIPKETAIISVIGPWIQLGKWWETNQKTGKIWLKITLQTTPELAENLQLLMVYTQRNWWLAGIW
ncbi:hypothetical protein NXS08_02035 [Gleimia sp. 6138-11-ORH1]|uniref:Y-family DNA polymerase n=1 Tax=Gleimia sp. 6138-11-ORH1 TaxID=2973937 RepID=UPI002169FDEA|nr:hypothetical protein [Gleimia sp. 6138-11-ORH1]MCS4484271.1 hypothetical protein [Gleimia sp. 6138-11-ORH1]